ncbi:MAG: hypothetical protein J6M60_04310 [Clostridia bacterium]|nr:hypothetical protein [Clostridia bacterium]
MDENIEIKEDVEVVEEIENLEKNAKEATEEIVEENVQNKKDEFDGILEKIKKMSEAVELHSNVKKAVSENEVDDNYLKYIENSLEDKLFNDAKFDRIKSKVLIEVVCPELVNIENFEIGKLEITDISSHYEEIENYIDKICLYDGKFICMFGVNERNAEDVLKYEARKFIRADMLEAIMKKVSNDKISKMEQYDEYYVITTDEGIKVYSERKATALLKMEETIFDKIKTKLSSLFNNTVFAKNKYLPKIDLIFDTNQNRLKNFKTGSKVDAKKRMKVLLNSERELTRSTENA